MKLVWILGLGALLSSASLPELGPGSTMEGRADEPAPIEEFLTENLCTIQQSVTSNGLDKRRRPVPRVVEPRAVIEEYGTENLCTIQQSVGGMEKRRRAQEPAVIEPAVIKEEVLTENVCTFQQTEFKRRRKQEPPVPEETLTENLSTFQQSVIDKRRRAENPTEIEETLTENLCALQQSIKDKRRRNEESKVVDEYLTENLCTIQQSISANGFNKRRQARKPQEPEVIEEPTESVCALQQSVSASGQGELDDSEDAEVRVVQDAARVREVHSHKAEKVEEGNQQHSESISALQRTMGITILVEKAEIELDGHPEENRKSELIFIQESAELVPEVVAEIGLDETVRDEPSDTFSTLQQTLLPKDNPAAEPVPDEERIDVFEVVGVDDLVQPEVQSNAEVESQTRSPVNV